MNVHGLTLRENLITEWRDGALIYCNAGGLPDGARDSLWVVLGGDFEAQFALVTDEQSWLEDDVVELSVSPGGAYLMIRGVETCYVADLPGTVEELRLSPHLRTRHVYNDLHVTECRWHPCCEDYLMALSDASIIALYTCASGVLQCTSPINLADDLGPVTCPHDPANVPPVTCIAPVQRSVTSAAAFFLFASGADGSLYVMGPYVPSGAMLRRETVDASGACGPDFENEVLNKVMQLEAQPGDSEQFVTAVPPEHLPDGQLLIPFQSNLGVLQNSGKDAHHVLSLHAVLQGDSVVVTALTTEQLHLRAYRVAELGAALAAGEAAEPMRSCSLPLPGVASLLSKGSPYTPFNALLHRYRYSFVPQLGLHGTPASLRSEPLVMCMHPGGASLLTADALGEWVEGGAVPTLEGSHYSGPLLFSNNGATFSAAQCVLLGAAAFADLHPEQQVALVLARQATGVELVTDHISHTSTPGVPRIPAASPSASASATERRTLSRLDRWARGDEAPSTLDAASRKNLSNSLALMCAAVHTARDSSQPSLEALQPAIAAQQHAGSALQQQLQVLQLAFDRKKQEAEAMLAELRSEAAELRKAADGRKERIVAKADAMSAANARGEYTEGVATAKAFTSLSAQLTPKLRCVSIGASAASLRALLSDAGLAVPSNLGEICGARAYVLKAGTDSSTVLLEDSPAVKVEMPNAALHDAPSPSMATQWEQALQSASLKTATIDRKTESIVRDISLSLKAVHQEMSQALAE